MKTWPARPTMWWPVTMLGPSQMSGLNQLNHRRQMFRKQSQRIHLETCVRMRGHLHHTSQRKALMSLLWPLTKACPNPTISKSLVPSKSTTKPTSSSQSQTTIKSHLPSTQTNSFSLAITTNLSNLHKCQIPTATLNRQPIWSNCRTIKTPQAIVKTTISTNLTTRPTRIQHQSHQRRKTPPMKMLTLKLTLGLRSESSQRSHRQRRHLEINPASIKDSPRISQSVMQLRTLEKPTNSRVEWARALSQGTAKTSLWLLTTLKKRTNEQNISI